MSWRTISRSARKRIQVRSGAGRPAHIHKTTGDGSDLAGFIVGAILMIATLCLIWEYLPVILAVVIIVAFVAMCSK